MFKLFKIYNISQLQKYLLNRNLFQLINFNGYKFLIVDITYFYNSNN